MTELKRVSKSFQDRADSAAFWEAWVGAVLARMGLYTLHHPFLIDGKDHSHSYDLTVFADDDLEWWEDSGRSIEVKSLSLTFTCPEDYPFEEVLVCSQNSWMNKWPGKEKTCRDFLFVSRATGHVIWLPVGSAVELGREIEDRGRGEIYKAVTTSSDNLRTLKEFVSHVKG